MTAKDRLVEVIWSHRIDSDTGQKLADAILAELPNLVEMDERELRWVIHCEYARSFQHSSVDIAKAVSQASVIKVKSQGKEE